MEHLHRQSSFNAQIEFTMHEMFYDSMWKVDDSRKSFDGRERRGDWNYKYWHRWQRFSTLRCLLFLLRLLHHLIRRFASILVDCFHFTHSAIASESFIASEKTKPLWIWSIFAKLSRHSFSPPRVLIAAHLRWDFARLYLNVQCVIVWHFK